MKGRGGGGSHTQKPRAKRRRKAKKQCDLGSECPYVNEMQHAQEFAHDNEPAPAEHVWGKAGGRSGGGAGSGRQRGGRSDAPARRAAWNCGACTFLNPAGGAAACGMCGSAAPRSSASSGGGGGRRERPQPRPDSRHQHQPGPAAVRAEAVIAASSGLAPISDVSAHNRNVDDEYELAKAIDQSKRQKQLEDEAIAARAAARAALVEKEARDAAAVEEAHVAARAGLSRAERARMFAAAFDRKAGKVVPAAAMAAVPAAVPAAVLTAVAAGDVAAPPLVSEHAQVVIDLT